MQQGLEDLCKSWAHWVPVCSKVTIVAMLKTIVSDLTGYLEHFPDTSSSKSEHSSLIQHVKYSQNPHLRSDLHMAHADCTVVIQSLKGAKKVAKIQRMVFACG